jgi:tetratricopeptide (TPR) repeat protein
VIFYIFENYIFVKIKFMRYILLFFLVTNTLHAQKAIVESYFDKYYNINTINKDSGFYYISKAYQLSKKSNLDSLASRSAYNIGRIYFYQSDFEKAKHFTNLAFIHAKKVNFQKLKIMSYMQLGTIERENSNYNKALSYYINSLKINKKHNDIDLEIEINNNIAILYTLQKDSVKALNYYKSNQRPYR